MKSTHTEAYQRVIAILVSARRERRLTQAALAERLGKPQSFVSKFELRERRLDVTEFFEVCRAIGANPLLVLRQSDLMTDADVLSTD